MGQSWPYCSLYWVPCITVAVHSNQYTNIAGEQCGVASSLARDRFPWDVRLGYRRAGRLGWFCSGLLVSSSWVLSAGHCHSSRRVNAALIGNYKFERKNGRSRRIFSKEENVQTLYIDKVFIHPDFQILKSRIIHHDIGLYHLTSKAQGKARGDTGQDKPVWRKILQS